MVVAKELEHIYKTLQALHREIITYSGDLHGLKLLQGRINEIDNLRINGVFGWKENSPVPEGQAEVTHLLHECHRQMKFLMDQYDDVENTELDPSLLPLKRELEDALKCLNDLNHKDINEIANGLPRVQGRLHIVEGKRVNGIFGVSKEKLPTSRVPPGQGVLADMLAEAYAAVRRLQEKTEKGQGRMMEEAQEAEAKDHGVVSM